jgi:Flp pilus assembly protein CpaB
VPRRLSRSPALFWLAAFTLAVLTGSVVARLAARVDALAARYGPLRPVVVAARDVEPGAALDDADLAVQELPAGFLPEGALAAARDAKGRVAVAPLARGQPLFGAHLAPEGVRGVAALLPPGTRGVAVPTGGASAPVLPGDTVDVLATFDPALAGGGDPTFPVAAGAVVVAVGEGSATVAVDPDEARAVAFAVANGSVTLVVAPVSARRSPPGRAPPAPPPPGTPRRG